jgi:hypothetical protein
MLARLTVRLAVPWLYGCLQICDRFILLAGGSVNGSTSWSYWWH